MHIGPLITLVNYPATSLRSDHGVFSTTLDKITNKICGFESCLCYINVNIKNYKYELHGLILCTELGLYLWVV